MYQKREKAEVEEFGMSKESRKLKVKKTNACGGGGGLEAD